MASFDFRSRSRPKCVGYALTPQYLRPAYQGQLHTIRRNTWNVILVLDLASAASLEIITQQVSHMIQRGIPIRFGIVPMFDASVNDICRCPFSGSERIDSLMQ